MRKNPIIAIAILLASLVPAMHQATAAPQTLDGLVSDSMCGKKHMMPGKSDADCTKECAKSGSMYVLVVGDKAYTLHAKADALAAFAGKHVQVKGEVKQNTIEVSSIREVR